MNFGSPSGMKMAAYSVSGTPPAVGYVCDKTQGITCDSTTKACKALAKAGENFPGEAAFEDRLGKAALKGRYVGACWGGKSADGFADSIEGAINLVNREPVASAMDWIDSQTRMMWAIQKADGIIEGWHGDGNFSRTSLMYALWKTQGTTVQPWRSDVQFGAVREGKTVYLSLSAERPWEGRLVFDRPRHTLFMHLPEDYARINQFPEWFTVEAGTKYELQLKSRRTVATGEELAAGIPLKLGPGETIAVEVGPRVP